MFQLKQFQSKQQETGPPEPSIDNLPAIAQHVQINLPQYDEQQSFPPPPPPLQQYEMPAEKHPQGNSDFMEPATPKINFDEVMAAINQRELESNIELIGTLKRSPDLSLQIAQLEAQQEQELAVERHRNSELNIQLRSQIGQFEALQNEMQLLQVANSTKSTMELGPLQEQLRAHVQTIGVLVGEKAELAAGLNKFQGLAKQKCEEVEELQGRLNASRHRVQVLEKDLADVRQSREQYNTGQERLCSELEACQEERHTLQKRLEDASDDIAELNQKLSLKNKDIGRLEVELTAARSEISLVNLRVQQFSAGDSLESDRTVEQLTQQKLHFERVNQDLQKMVQQLGTERDQSNAQYQSYVQQLNKDSATLAAQLQEYVGENERLSKREESLVKHVGDLERQIQQQMTKQKNFKEVHVNRDNSVAEDSLNSWIAKYTALEAEKLQLQVSSTSLYVLQYLKCVLTSQQQHQDNLQVIQSLQLQLQQKQQTIVDMESAMEMLQSHAPADAQRLVASMESDKVAASRAVAQNQELKQQLDEIQRAFVQIVSSSKGFERNIYFSFVSQSNDKLELTDRLQSEQHLGKENKLKAGTLDVEVTSIKEKLHYKDEEMIRLTHENDKLNKEILQMSQELDRLRHYEAKGQSNNTLQQQLQAANEAQRHLRHRIKQLEQSAAVTAGDMATTINANSDQDIAATEDTDATVPNDDEVIDALSVTTSTVNIATEEAMEKLQQRFTKTMLEIADLTEEKNRLEHLVTQLQGETETIGEYIALYQKQRRLLKQRELEKDVQLQQIVSDREEMREKLQQLNALVEQLLRQKKQSGTVPDEPLKGENQNHNDVANLNGTEASEVDRLMMRPNGEDITGKVTGASGDTAVRILNLLSEIQDKNQNQKFSDTPSTEVHNCAYCYGKLETV